jgi:hypothetical protein
VLATSKDALRDMRAVALVGSVASTLTTRSFNTAGPCRSDDHYMLATESRLPTVRSIIDGKHYFVLHAPRQVGKTTSLLALGAALTAEGRYAAVMVSMETGAPYGHDHGMAENVILSAWRDRAASWLPPDLQPPPWPDAIPGTRIRAALRAWSLACPRPLVVFLDEIDALSGELLISVLRQIRDGHPNRPGAFPWSLALVGMRDVRDYKLATDVDRAHSSSPFNIKVESFTMRDFTAAEVEELYAQHTAETGQRFEAAAVTLAFELTQGQPWLVNALARQVTEEFVTDRAHAVTAADVMLARDRLIEREDTHLDSLAERLREPRVRSIIDPMLSGGDLPVLPPDDVRFVKDLGLVREGSDGTLEVSNPIYREIIGRSLALSVRLSMPRITTTWIAADGTLDVDALLEAWVSFWTLHGETLQAASPYSEAAAHLVLLAFLHRVVNGGGRIEREYAVGTGRMDLRVEYKGAVLGIEVKTWRDRDKRGDPVAQGLAQVDAYLTRVGATRGWLVVFDQRKIAKPLPERLSVEHVQRQNGRMVAVVRV